MLLLVLPLGLLPYEISLAIFLILSLLVFLGAAELFRRTEVPSAERRVIAAAIATYATVNLSGAQAGFLTGALLLFGLRHHGRRLALHEGRVVTRSGLRGPFLTFVVSPYGFDYDMGALAVASASMLSAKSGAGRFSGVAMLVVALLPAFVLPLGSPVFPLLRSFWPPHSGRVFMTCCGPTRLRSNRGNQVPEGSAHMKPLRQRRGSIWQLFR